MNSAKQLERVEMAAQLAKKSSLVKAKKTYELLGDESLNLQRCLVDAEQKQREELELLKAEVLEMMVQVKELNFQLEKLRNDSQ